MDLGICRDKCIALCHTIGLDFLVGCPGRPLTADKCTCFLPLLNDEMPAEFQDNMKLQNSKATKEENNAIESNLKDSCSKTCKLRYNTKSIKFFSKTKSCNCSTSGREPKDKKTYPPQCQGPNDEAKCAQYCLENTKVACYAGSCREIKGIYGDKWKRCSCEGRSCGDASHTNVTYGNSKRGSRQI